MIRHHLQFNDVCPSLSSDIFNDLLQPLVDRRHENGSAVLRAPHDKVGAAVHNVVIGTDVSHMNNIHLVVLY